MTAPSAPRWLLCLLLAALLLLPVQAPAAVVAYVPPRVQLFSAINGTASTIQFRIGTERYIFDNFLTPRGIDIDSNGTQDLSFQVTRGPNDTVSVTLAGRNQVWSYAGGVAGHDAGTHAISLLGGTSLGPGLHSDIPSLGWHNDEETQGYSVIMSTSNFRPVSGDFFPSYDFEQKYLGLRFERDGRIHYGWMALSGFDKLGLQVYVHSWAWESEPDTPIIVGLIPEPGTAALLAGTGLVCLRRRRKGTR